eukprot:CAMPEP_0118869492 /NCGR_PEP_ID=MMETSP1163-20130328/12813_1 /TAXON_ID=124430 /ORGANISM="Phaeomonas parva, Strain CCMP2877" /LENGTH=92 /DNA_ID=CAMNT_0006804391 /DNA_START=105 /DNA_END=379 /DNA_ORIENTATION=+
MDPDQPELVSETVLKRRREHERSRIAENAAAELKRVARRRKAKKAEFKRPETFLAEFTKKDHDESRAKRKLKLSRERQGVRRAKLARAAKKG